MLLIFQLFGKFVKHVTYDDAVFSDVNERADLRSVYDSTFLNDHMVSNMKWEECDTATYHKFFSRVKLVE